MPILKQPGQLRPDVSNTYGLDALVSNNNDYSVDPIVVSQSGTNVTLTQQQTLPLGIVRLTGAASCRFHESTLPPTARVIDARWDRRSLATAHSRASSVCRTRMRRTRRR